MISRLLVVSKACVTQIKGKQDLAKFGKGNYVLNFYADWCGPCKAMAPFTAKREEEAKGKWSLLKVNIDAEQNAELCQQFQIQAVPTLVYFKDGKEVHKTIGGLNAQKLDEALKKIL